MSYSLLAHFSAIADIRAALFFETYGMLLNETKHGKLSREFDGISLNIYNKVM